MLVTKSYLGGDSERVFRDTPLVRSRQDMSLRSRAIGIFQILFHICRSVPLSVGQPAPNVLHKNSLIKFGVNSVK